MGEEKWSEMEKRSTRVVSSMTLVKIAKISRFRDVFLRCSAPELFFWSLCSFSCFFACLLRLPLRLCWPGFVSLCVDRVSRLLRPRRESQRTGRERVKSEQTGKPRSAVKFARPPPPCFLSLYLSLCGSTQLEITQYIFFSSKREIVRAT